MSKIRLLLWYFVVSSISFGYVREVSNDSAHIPLLRTDNTAIQFLLNAGVTPGAPNPSGSCVTTICAGSDPLAAVRRSLATWNAAPSANINFLPLQSTSLGISQADCKMVIAVGSSAADLSAVGGALAVTAIAFATTPQTTCGATVTEGSILDSDIIINPAYSFSTDGSTAYDLQAVITHELGHALSANHTGLLGAVMFQFNSGQRFLTADDVAFAVATYPAPNGAANLGTISGTVTTALGAPVAFALLTAFDTSAGVTTGGLTNPDGTYSFQVPPGNYQIYAEPLNGAIAINIYLSQNYPGSAAGTGFETTLYAGSLNVAANGAAVANIAVTSGTSKLAAPVVAVSPVNGNPLALAYIGGPATAPSGQSVDLILAGAGFDSTLSDSNFAVYGQGISIVPGSVRVDPTHTLNGFNALRVTLKVAASSTPSLASFIVTSGLDVTSFSGALVIVPPTPTFVSAAVISAAAYAGIPAEVSPGGLYSIYGANLGSAGSLSGFDPYGNLPASLAGITVTFDGVPAPMFSSSNGQLNFQAPFEVTGKTSTKVIVNNQGSASAPVTVPVFPTQPDFFTYDGKAVIAVNLPDRTLNTAQNPAARGSTVEVYGTGVGKAANYTIFTGQGAPTPPANLMSSYTYSIGGSSAAQAQFGGWTPTAVGLAQWDLKIPAGAPTGAVSIIVRDSTGVSSQPGATIFVK